MPLLATFVAWSIAACSDVGDSSAVPGGGEGGSSGLDATSGGHADSSSSSSGGTDDGAPQATNDGAPSDSSEHDAESEDVAAPGLDATGEDVASPDVESQDVESQDVESLDAGATDVQSEGAAADAGDAAAADATAGDALDDAAQDAQDAPGEVADGSDAADAADAELDATDGGGPLAPCTQSNPTGCVQCQGNIDAGANTNLCSPTEAQFVRHDIAKGIATAPGPDPAAGCYTCLLGGGCIDDTQFNDTGHECEDPFATFGTAAECESVITCILGSSCATTAVSTCYCGTAGVSTACQGNPAPGPINGACDTQIAAGLNFPVTDGTDNTKNLTDITRAAGKADQIFQCAQSNGCTACLQ
jgi:hypothetical protein